MPEKSVRARISGRVQGVWFRGWTLQTALALRLDGWVRNRADGTVEAVFSGDGQAVDKMLEIVQDGPPMARVTGMDVQDEQPPMETGFKTLPTV